MRLLTAAALTLTLLGGWASGAGADVNASAKSGQTALMFAEIKGRERVARKLIESGAEVNAKDEIGETALWCAVGYGAASSAQIKALLDAGADPDAQAPPRFRVTSLMTAAEHCRVDVVKVLIDGGAELDIRDQSDMTALTHASVGGCAAAAKLIRER
jgi:ankyrin repeat protein